MDYSKIQDQYDSLYSTSEDLIYFSGKPLNILEKLLAIKTEGTVLDVGGGDGRNALFLARKGFDVTVIDLSQVGLDKLQGFAQQEGLPIKTIAADATKYEYTQMYDVVIFSNVLHHTSVPDTEVLLDTLKDRTNKSGIHIISTFANEGELYDRNLGKNRFYPSPDMVREMYCGWEVHHLEMFEMFSRAKNKNGEQLRNQVVHFMAEDS